MVDILKPDQYEIIWIKLKECYSNYLFEISLDKTQFWMRVREIQSDKNISK